ncbi:uncharacterized protein C7orf50 homolog [Acipenser ruthenus]|uniref:uncharacterized protein C7orf50 homolog n=1 Tax=Acipenser ruthenus TaxID=7906 RepID=UPI00155F85E1|nr:uncharacterized protein C7orf50 homolog [Acipenser ruthenus]XP_034782741.1 uncharacterized protein C7orf50 homolog [Acipenser ruthenus]XP_058851713.1 uncharacterized protein C7orf50 homolog [Acipenser ruthenus]
MTKSKITKPESESVEIKRKTKQKTKKRVAEEMEQKPCEEKEEGEPERRKKKKKSKVKEPEEVLPEVQGEEEEEEDEEGLTPEERRILERKIKKERKKEEKQQMKEAGVSAQETEPVKPSGSQMAQDYLTCWSKNRKDWSFKKTRQTWLLKHMFDSEKVPDELFDVLLEYLDGLKGGARETTVKAAESVIRDCEDSEDSAAAVKAGRAREVIQLLSS